MYTPDGYLYETNLALLAGLTDDELANAELLAQAAPGAAFAPLGDWFLAACKRALAGLAGAFAYVPAEDRETALYWLYPPMF
jgi:hypothetical protein